MKKEEKTDYVKRSQKDYSLSLKLQVVQEIERGELSTTGAERLWSQPTFFPQMVLVHGFYEQY